jgi:flagellar hook-basal body complex protein FliE
MAIAPIPSLPSLPALPPPVAAPAAGSAGALGPTGTALGGPGGPGAATGPGGFGSLVANALDALTQAQRTATADEANAAAGQGSLTDTMIAASVASLDTQVATALIDKGLAAYTSIADMTF